MCLMFECSNCLKPLLMRYLESLLIHELRKSSKTILGRKPQEKKLI